jgi:sterol desaturase/sphingolipid hydroxylase (fatty acid hydroxylase superfamily)
MENEATTRLAIFIGLFLLLAAAEHLLPRRKLNAKKPKRWLTNWALVLIDTATLRLLAFALPALAVGAALDASSRSFGLFNQTNWPIWLEFILALVILDLLIWAQHLITHKIPLLWRLHRVHHADTDFDVTTAIRFHPVEIALSMVLKIGAVYLLGPAALAVIAFEIILNGCAMFNHANLRLSPTTDGWLRLFLVTPDMHRVHHSDKRAEHDSNYGFSISLWDRLFKTYIAQPKDGHDAMTIGLQWQNENPTRLDWSLKLPFSNK